MTTPRTMRRSIAATMRLFVRSLASTTPAFVATLAVAGGAIAQAPAAASSATAAPVLRTTGAFFALTVADIDATRAWYAEKSGLSVLMDATGDGARSGSTASSRSGW